MNPRLPKDRSLDGVLSRTPDPPTMNAGMPRGISLDAIKTMNARKRLMDMGADEVMRLLGDSHEGDYRHLFDTEKPHAFRHGIQDAGADEIRQLIAEFQGAGGFDKVKKSDMPFFDKKGGEIVGDKVYVKSPCCPAGVGTRERGGKLVCIDCEKELDFNAVLDMSRYHDDYDEDGDGIYVKRSLDTDSTFDTAWELMKANTPCCPNKRMVERKDGTMRCRVCGSTDSVTKSDMKPCGRCGNETHEDELKFNFGVCDGCDQHRDGLRYQQDKVKKSDDKGDNAPTNPSLWAQAKSKARSKFKVYPSAYANGWAAKWYKSKGGGWKKKGKKSKK